MATKSSTSASRAAAWARAVTSGKPGLRRALFLCTQVAGGNARSQSEGACFLTKPQIIKQRHRIGLTAYNPVGIIREQNLFEFCLQVQKLHRIGRQDIARQIIADEGLEPARILLGLRQCTGLGGPLGIAARLPEALEGTLFGKQIAERLPGLEQRLRGRRRPVRP